MDTNAYKVIAEVNGQRQHEGGLNIDRAWQRRTELLAAGARNVEVKLDRFRVL